MRTFACLIVVLLLSACGGDSENIEPKTTDKTWATGQFMPSSYFANRCINPRINTAISEITWWHKLTSGPRFISGFGFNIFGVTTTGRK